jgi:hypothetical protein
MKKLLVLGLLILFLAGGVQASENCKVFHYTSCVIGIDNYCDPSREVEAGLISPGVLKYPEGTRFDLKPRLAKKGYEIVAHSNDAEYFIQVSVRDVTGPTGVHFWYAFLILSQKDENGKLQTIYDGRPENFEDGMFGGFPYGAPDAFRPGIAKRKIRKFLASIPKCRNE